jgi:glycosyltransferase involved in cell wall biosynthesis
MCTYNGSRYLREQLDSISSQTCSPFELVVCDDGSSDSTLSILNDFASRARFLVRVFSNAKRLGPARNFGQAIELCTGDIIALCDQDDIWYPHKLSTVAAAFHEHPSASYAFSDATMIDSNGTTLGSTLWDAVGLQQQLADFSGVRQVKMLLRKSLIQGAALAFPSALRCILLPIPPGWMHDYWIVLLGSTLSSGVPINEPLLKYRRHGDQACGWKKKTFLQVCRESLSTGADESWDKLEQFRSLVQRVEGVEISTHAAKEYIQLLKQKEKHLQVRAATRSRHGISKVATVVRETLSGRYQRFQEASLYSILRDLC